MEEAKMAEEGKCNFCDGLLVKEEIKAKKNNSWKRKAYHFKYRLRCPKCRKCFNLESSKYSEVYDLPPKLPPEIQPNNAQFENSKKRVRQHRMDEFLKETIYEIEDLEIEKQQMNESQWRLTIGKEIVDIYPKGQKYCHINLKHWGSYTDLEKLINSFKV